jgi:hypothetical protein
MIHHMHSYFSCNLVCLCDCAMVFEPSLSDCVLRELACLRNSANSRVSESRIKTNIHSFIHLLLAFLSVITTGPPAIPFLGSLPFIPSIPGLIASCSTWFINRYDNRYYNCTKMYLWYFINYYVSDTIVK